MAFRQSGTERLAVRSHHDPSSAAPDSADVADQINIRIPHAHKHNHRTRRSSKLARRLPAAALIVLLLVLLVSLLSVHRLSLHHQALETGSAAADNEFRPRGNLSLPQKELNFGHGGVSAVAGARDSRGWDRDDRRRDHDYSEDDVSNHGADRARHKLTEAKGGDGRLYNEGGQAELDTYKDKYEASLKNAAEKDAADVIAEDEYDDGIDLQEDPNELDQEEGDDSDGNASLLMQTSGGREIGASEKDASSKPHKVGTSELPRNTGADRRANSRHVPNPEKKSGNKKKPPKPKHRSSSPCGMKLLNSTATLVEPVEHKKFSRFSLQYTDVEEKPFGLENWEPRFSGHQTLQEREESFYARDQTVNCGFIRSPNGSPSTGFDLAEDDVKFMSSCHIAVSSCIFGNSDRLRSPFSKTITRQSRKNVCFVIFLDEDTLNALLSEGQQVDSGGFIGLWKIVVVKNLPYTDMRRVGKIPKFLTHRLFPSARYSIWLDSKLRLQTDPYLILEYFLWRRGYEYAISNHYDRHCVSEEVVQNKKLNKFNHTVIDQQFQFYQSDGLKKFDPSDPKKLLPSYVPEGSFIVRAHTPMSNLFSCLWFNEVDRFTPRDQLSFAYTYLKLRRMNPLKPFHLNMFKDCERRSMAKLFRHRAEEKRTTPK